MGDGKTVTYRELDLISGKVYRYLKTHGIGREDFVNILLPRGVEPVIAMIGVWKAGAAFVMLEQDYPEERIAIGSPSKKRNASSSCFKSSANPEYFG
jgi:non-ribosomal peptide synthetase component F